jgi:acyl-CoA thioester hydrolase
VTLEHLPWTETVIEVPFHDVDAMGIVWHGRYAKYFELARCQLLESIGYNYPEMRESGYAWPVIDIHIRYVQVIRFRQKIRVRVEVVEYESCLKLRYLITDPASGRRLTKGTTTMVAVDIDNQEMLLASPAILLERLKTWLP